MLFGQAGQKSLVHVLTYADGKETRLASGPLADQLAQRLYCCDKCAFDGLEFVLLHARRNIDDKGQAARQGIALRQLGQGR